MTVAKSIEREIVNLFLPLIDLPCWQARRSIGSFVCVNFGLPYLDIREPKTTSRDTPADVKRLYQRRRVTPVGEFRFWLENCFWSFTSPGCPSVVTSDTPNTDPICLEDMEGQKLLSAQYLGAGKCLFSFDLGGMLETSLQETFKNDDQWSVSFRDGRTVTFTGDGRLTLENRR
jgi:hypothetical protein